MRFLAIAVMALVLAVPPSAQAQSFGIFFGDERSDFRPRHRGLPMCLTDRQVRTVIAEMGYDNIALNARQDDHIQVRASRGRTSYLIDFNPCNGRIEGRRRLR